MVLEGSMFMSVSIQSKPFIRFKGTSRARIRHCSNRGCAATVASTMAASTPMTSRPASKSRWQAPPGAAPSSIARSPRWSVIPNDAIASSSFSQARDTLSPGSGCG